MTADLGYLDVAGRPIAYRLRSGRAPTLLFLPGYASDMEGAKALALDAFAARHGRAMLRLDYSGTGASPGNFDESTLDHWLAEALAALDRLATGPVIVVGSSMGGWIGLHLALARPDRVVGLVGIAAAPDFTNWGFTAEQRAAIARAGKVEQPQVVTHAFLESGTPLCLLGEPIAIHCPVRLIHGEADADVPLPVAHLLLQQLESADAQLTIVKGGGHRLSEPHEIDLILRTVGSLADASAAEAE